MRHKAQFIGVGVVAMIGGAIALAVGLINPSHDRPVSIMYAVAGAWGIATAFGIFFRWRWARISTLIFAGLTAYAGASFAPLLAFLQTPVRLGNSPASEPRLSFFLIGVAVAALGLWWIVLFSTLKSREFFQIHSSDSTPVAISVIGWYLIATGTFGLMALLRMRHQPASMHFGFVFTGWEAIVTNVSYAAFELYLGISLLRRRRRGPQLAIYYGLFLLLDICIFLFRPDRDARVSTYNTLRLTNTPGMVSRFTSIAFSHFLQLASIEWAVFTGIAIWLLAMRRNDLAGAEQSTKSKSDALGST